MFYAALGRPATTAGGVELSSGWLFSRGIELHGAAENPRMASRANVGRGTGERFCSCDRCLIDFAYAVDVLRANGWLCIDEVARL